MHIKDQKPLDENGQPHGEWLIYNNNGQLWYRINYVHGIAHGLCEEYNSKGQLWYRGYCKMGKFHGIKESYYKGRLNCFSFNHMDENLLFVTLTDKELSLSL